jgi:peptidoglycan/LPS O-acetylase OafA/YrhL
MGSLRTVFAIAVVFAHTGFYMFVGGENAVQIFYMISGFLISFVLTEVKAYPDKKRFYLNRFLRLYPIYIAVALMTLSGYLLGLHGADDFLRVYRAAPMAADVLLGISNATLFFQDWVMFSAVADGRLVFSADFRQSAPLLYQGLLVPQAWTLGVELTFYVIAPFVLSRKWLVCALIMGSLMLRALFVFQGFGANDPWSYRFFPTELALFLLGSLSHQHLLPLYRRVLRLRARPICIIGTGVMLAAALTYHLYSVPRGINSVVLFAVFFLLMPLSFMFQSMSRVDKWIGDLSYPIYIGHILVILVLTQFAASLKAQHPLQFAWLCVMCSVLFAVLLNRLVGSPIETLRATVRAKSSGGTQRRSAVPGYP